MSVPLTLSTCVFASPPDDYDAWMKNLALLTDSGFSGVEVGMYPQGDVSGIIRALQKSRVPVVAVHGIMGGGSCSDDPGIRAQAIADAGNYLAKFADFAGVPVVEHYWNRFNAPEKALYFHESCAVLLEKIRELGFIFCMENDPYKPEDNERYPMVEEIADFARSYGENRMFMTLDLNHVNLNEDPFEVCRRHASMIQHIHISDNHGIREEHLPPGEGVIPLAEIVRTLRENGFAGPCNLEMIFRTAGDPGKRELSRVYNYCQQIFDSGDDA